ncbi:MAG: hypothetical protein JWO36_7269 [Myxococcales bacterium]|nr:hypothetical protein [Myxococcales bacterium]
MRVHYDSELERLLEQAREMLGAGDDAVLADANTTVNQALQLSPDSVEGWLLKCQVASAAGDDLAALAAVEMALRREPERGEALYWHGAVLGDLCRHREALRSIECALRVLTDDEQWLVEDLFYEKVTILDALGLHDAAVAACSAGLDHCPGSALLRAALGPLSSETDLGADKIHRERVRSSLKVLRGGAG